MRFLATLVLGGLLAAPVAYGQRPKTPCGIQRNEDVVLRTTTAVVTRELRSGGGKSYDTYYGCLDGARHRVLLGSKNVHAGSNESVLSGFELAGPYVTFVLNERNRYVHPRTAIEQYNLRDGRLRFLVDYREGPEVQSQNPLASSSPQNPPNMILTANGLEAWVLAASSCTPMPECQYTVSLIVYIDGGPRTVTSYVLPVNGSPLQISNIHLTSKNIAWEHQGIPSSTEL
jgi:hypothetical protein